MKAVLTIAGSDSGGGAGIQADIKTMTAHNVYAMSVITALTAQNTTGVYDIMVVTPEFIKEQMDCIFNDIRPDAVKIGMLPSPSIILAVAEKLKQYRVGNVVIDPVMISTSGRRLSSEEAIVTLKKILLPMGDVITPNISEAEVLTGVQIHSAEDMEKAAKELGDLYHCAVLCKGGHRRKDADDLLYFQGRSIWFSGKRIDNPNTHGTGCTLSSAIASNLAKGYGMEEAVQKAKNYISGALNAGLNLGKGQGPLNHAFAIKGEY